MNKDCDPIDILNAIRIVATGQRYITPTVANLLAGQFMRRNGVPLHAQLSEREFQVFLKLAKGESVGAIAQALSLSLKTVSTYRTRLTEKLNLKSNSDITYYAIKHGLIE